MKNLTALCLGVFLLIGGGLACKNPLAKYTKQYSCTIAGEPEPQTADGFVTRAHRHLESSGYADQFDRCAFDAAQEAVRLDPHNADALSLRGNLYRAKGDYDAALDDLSGAIRLKPGNPLFHSYRSVVYEKKNMPKEAIEDLSVSLKNDPAHQTYARRGSLHFKNNDYENAVKDYTEAIRLEPDHKSHYTMRAEVYRKLGKNAEAAADESKVKELDNLATDPILTVEPTEDPSQQVTNPQLKYSANSTTRSDSKTISGGVMNGKATNLVKPAYPPAARAVQASGAVNVQVTIDENGDVVAATAVSGHPLLRTSAVQAARASKFSPTLLSGKPVKVTGVVVYNFTP